jgi:hypothetical protein
MEQRQDLPGSSDFINALTLYILFVEYPNDYKKMLFNRETYDIVGISKKTFNDARKKATKRFYGPNLDLNLDDFKKYLSIRLTSIKNPVVNGRFKTAYNFLNSYYDKDGKFKDRDANSPEKATAPASTYTDNAATPAPLVPAPAPKPTAPTKPTKAPYKTREEVIEELMSQGKITDPSQAVALSSPVTVNGRTFQALISPLGTLPGPGGVRVPIINDQQANSYAMSLLKEYNRLAGVGYQPLNDIGKGNLNPKNTEPLKKLLTRIDLAVKNKTSHEQSSNGEPILPQMREPKLSTDTENLYNILKRLSGQTLGLDNPTNLVLVKPADEKINDLKKNDTVKSKSLNPTTPSTPADQIIDSSALFFNDEKGIKIPGSDSPSGFFEYILDWFETSEYYNVSNKMSEADFIKRITDCKTPNDKNNIKKCWTEFPEFIRGKLSSILDTYRSPDNKIYKTLTTFIPLRVILNIDMIINLIEANDARYSNLSESFIGG